MSNNLICKDKMKIEIEFQDYKVGAPRVGSGLRINDVAYTINSVESLSESPIYPRYRLDCRTFENYRRTR